MARRNNQDLRNWQPKNLFGGDFTPFRDLWQTAAGEAGITTKLMRKNALEAEAAQELELQNANIALAEAFQGATPEEQMQIAQLMRDRAAVHRPGGQTPDVPNGAALAAPFIAAQQQRREAGEAAEADWLAKQEQRQYDLRRERRDEYKTQIQDFYSRTRSANAEADTVLRLLNELGDGSEAVQSRFRDLIGMSVGDAKQSGDGLSLSGRVSIPGLSVSVGGGGDEAQKYTRDEIIKGVLAWRQGQTDLYMELARGYNQSAVNDGFYVDTTDGVVHVEDLTTPDDMGYRPVAGRTAPIAGDTVAAAAGDDLEPPPPNVGVIKASDQPPPGLLEGVARSALNAMDPEYVALADAANALGAENPDDMTILQDGRVRYGDLIYEPAAEARERLKARRARRFNQQHVEGVIQRPVNE